VEVTSEDCDEDLPFFVDVEGAPKNTVAEKLERHAALPPQRRRRGGGKGGRASASRAAAAATRIMRTRLLVLRAATPSSPRPLGFPTLKPRSELPPPSRPPRWQPGFVTNASAFGSNKSPSLEAAAASGGFTATAALEEAHAASAADVAFDVLCTDCLKELQDTCTAALSGEEFHVAPFDWSPDVRLEPFGSVKQGTALLNSDLDVRLSFEQFAVRDEQRQIRYLEAVEARPGPHFEVLRLVRARLPVLRLRFRGHLEVDLSMGEELASEGEVDLAVQELLYASPDSGARRFVRLVKMFAKAHSLIDAHGGYLNSVSWVFLSIAFLQMESCLPPYHELQQQQQQQANSSTTTRGTRPLWPVRPTLSLLSRFFAFVDRCATEPHLVSVSEGQVRAIHRRNHGSRGGVPPPPMIEHPTKAGYNVAQCLLPKGWAETAERCRRAHTMLASAMRACNTKNYAAAIAWVLSGDGGEGSETGQVLARDEACPAPKRRRLDPAGAGDPEFLPVNGPSYRECASCGIVHRCPSWMEKRATYCPKCRRSYNDTRSWS